MRTAAKIDDNQSEIVDALRSVGCSVQSMAAIGNGCPDLLICSPWKGHMLFELKDGSKPPSKRKLTPAQEIWHMNWIGDVHIVTSVDEALIAVGAITGG